MNTITARIGMLAAALALVFVLSPAVASAFQGRPHDTSVISMDRHCGNGDYGGYGGHGGHHGW